MLKSGILNPDINSLLGRVRHANPLVIADRGFPFWPMIETIDVSLVNDIPTVPRVFVAIRPNFDVGQLHMAQEFLDHNTPAIKQQFHDTFDGVPVIHERHDVFRKRVPDAIGLVCTVDTIQYANLILVSA